MQTLASSLVSFTELRNVNSFRGVIQRVRAAVA